MSVPAAGHDQRRAGVGALDYAAGEVLWQIEAQKSGAAFATVLQTIADRWPTDQLILVLDNVSYHRSPVVRDWWQQQAERITPRWLPKYSPNLNLIERVWRSLKQKLACHRFGATIDDLQAAAETLLDRLVARFHTDDGPSIFLRKDLCKSA